MFRCRYTRRLPKREERRVLGAELTKTERIWVKLRNLKVANRPEKRTMNKTPVTSLPTQTDEQTQTHEYKHDIANCFHLGGGIIPKRRQFPMFDYRYSVSDLKQTLSHS